MADPITAPIPRHRRPVRRWPWIVAFAVTAVALLVSVLTPSGTPAVAAVASAGPAPVTITSYVASPPSTVYATRTETVTVTASPTTTSSAAEAATSTGYVYKVFGASRGSITYSSAGGGSSQATNAKLPWTKTVESPGYGGMTFAYVSAQNGGGGTIRCQIIGPSGQVIAENSAEGEYAIVTCSP